MPQPESEPRELTTERLANILEFSMLGEYFSGLTHEVIEFLANQGVQPRSFEHQVSSSYAKTAQEVKTSLRENKGLMAMYSSAAEHPARIVISAKSGHQPSIDAAKLANTLGTAEVDFIGPETGSEQEKAYYAAVLADISKQRLETKIAKLNDQNRALLSKKLLDGEDKRILLSLRQRLVSLNAKLVGNNFEDEAKDRLFGEFGPIWLSTLRAYAGEYQAVVGGGDCPTAEFIRSLLQGTTASLGRLSSTYILAGPTPEGMSRSFVTEKDNGEITSNRILAVTDAALEPLPTVEERADAAFATAQVLQILFPDIAARIAFASYSTGSSGAGSLVDEDRRAYETFKEKYPDSGYSSYGPIQFDAATSERIANQKRSSFVRDLELGKISQEELDAFNQVAGLATILSLQNLEVGNTLVKGLHAAWKWSVQIGPLILPHNRIKSPKSGQPLVASDLSRGEKPRSIASTLTAISNLVHSIEVKSNN